MTSGVGHDRPLRRILLPVSVVLAAGVASAALILMRGAPDAAEELVEPLGLGHDPPFAIRLSGPMWQDRTIRDDDGVPDVAIVTTDRRLDISVRATGSAPVGTVRVLVDGRQHLQRSCSGACRSFSVRARPPLQVLAPGDHRVSVVVVARSAAKTARAAAALSLRTARAVPAAIESESLTAPAAAAATAISAQRRRQALRVLAIARRRELRVLLGDRPVKIVRVGELSGGGRALGVTLFLELVHPVRDLSARVPEYRFLGAGRYVAREVDVRVATLRDVLVDVDLRRRRVIAVEPGPRSTTTRWTASDGAEPSGIEDED